MNHRDQPLESNKMATPDKNKFDLNSALGTIETLGKSFGVSTHVGNVPDGGDPVDGRIELAQVEWVKSVLDLPLGSFPVRDYDENAVRKVAEVLKISLRDRRELAHYLSVSPEETRDENLFYNKFLDVLEQAPWMFAIANTNFLKSQPAGKKNRKNLIFRIFDHTKWRKALPGSEPVDEEEIYTTAGLNITEIFLLYLTTALNHLWDWLDEKESESDFNREDFVAHLMKIVLNPGQMGEIAMQPKTSEKQMQEQHKVELIDQLSKTMTQLAERPSSDLAREIVEFAKELRDLLEMIEVREGAAAAEVLAERVEALVLRLEATGRITTDFVARFRTTAKARPDICEELEEALTICEAHDASVQSLEARQQDGNTQLAVAVEARDRTMTTKAYDLLDVLQSEADRLKTEDPIKAIEAILDTAVSGDEEINSEKALGEASAPETSVVETEDAGTGEPQPDGVARPKKTETGTDESPSDAPGGAAHPITIDCLVDEENNPSEASEDEAQEASAHSIGDRRQPEPESESEDHRSDLKPEPVTEEEPDNARQSISARENEQVGSATYMDIEVILARLLDADRVCIAARLCAAAARRGWAVPIASRSLAAAAAGKMSFGRFSHEVQLFSGLVSDAHQDKSEIGQAMLFCSLLKPAILRNETPARSMIKLLKTGLGDSVALLQNEIGNLGYEFAPSMHDLHGIGGRTPVDRSPELRKEIVEWRDSCLSRHTNHQPSRVILKTLVSHGALGDYLRDIEAENASAAERVGEIVNLYGDGEMVEERIREIERETGVLERSRIRYHKLEWIERNILEGVGQIQDWAASVLENMPDKSYGARSKTPAIVDKLRKAVKAAVGDIDEQADVGETDDLGASVRRFARTRLQAFDKFLAGDSDTRGLPFRAAISSDLDLLPAGCEPRCLLPLETLTEFEDTPDALLGEDNAVIAALSSGQLVSDEEAFREKLKAGAFATATRLLPRLVTSGKAEEQLIEDIREAHEVMTANFLRSTRELQHRLKDLSNIDLHFGEEINHKLEELEKIEDLLTRGALAVTPGNRGRIDPDPSVFLGQHYEIPPVFKEAEVLADKILVQIQHDQAARLDDLLERKPEAAVDIELLKSKIDEIPVQTLDDQIAQLSEGLPLTLDAPETKITFDAFFPDFVALAQDAGTGIWPKSVADYEEAFVHGASWPDALHLGAMEDQEAAGQVMAAWFKIMRSLSQGNSSPRSIEGLLRLLGVPSPSVKPPQRVSGVEMFRHDAHIQITASGWFLPPIFGSRSGGRYRLYSCTKQVPLEQIEAELAGRDQTIPRIVLMAGRLSVERRRKIADIFRKRRLPALVIDETLMAFIAIHSGRRLAVLFDCASPFAYVQPYTTDAGRLPPEIFFGREREIEQIIDMSADGTLVYGGRQLGKSALLHHVEGLYHDPSQGKVVLRRDVTYVGRPSDPAETIWRRIAEGLAEHGVTKAIMTSANDVVGAIRRWLDEDSERRVLILLDETDNFMSSEARSGYANLTPFKELMEVTHRRFKIVFAGLHNVRRMLEAPNSPLHHLGSICVGPLTRTIEDKRSARALVTEPLRSAGFRLDKDSSINDILAFVSHYPSLIQVFMKEIVTTLKPEGEGPLFTIRNENLFRGESFAAIQAAVRDRFNYTLDLDPRFKLIAATLAQMRYEDDNLAVIQAGVPVDRIRTAVRANWPKSLQTVDEVSFRYLLDEMADLGVLSQDEEGGKRLYRLRTSQITQMIGSSDQVDEILLALNEREANVDYDSGIYRRRYQPQKSAKGLELRKQPRMPLVDGQMSKLLNQASGVQMIIGLRELGLDEVPEAIESGCGPSGKWNDREGLIFEKLVITQKALRRVLDKCTEANLFVFMKPGKQDSEKFAKFCDEHPNVISGQVTPVILLDARSKIDRDLALRRKAIALKPWGHQMLRAHLEESDALALDNREIRDALLDVTGGMPSPLIKLVAQLCENGGSVRAEAVRDFAPNVTLPDFGGEAELSKLLESMIETDAVDDYNALEEIFQAETGEILDDAVGILEMLGLVEQHDPMRGLLRLSRLAQMVAEKK
jgi:hypothetical protein